MRQYDFKNSLVVLHHVPWLTAVERDAGRLSLRVWRWCCRRLLPATAVPPATSTTEQRQRLRGHRSLQMTSPPALLATLAMVALAVNQQCFSQFFLRTRTDNHAVAVIATHRTLRARGARRHGANLLVI